MATRSRRTNLNTTRNSPPAYEEEYRPQQPDELPIYSKTSEHDSLIPVSIRLSRYSSNSSISSCDISEKKNIFRKVHARFKDPEDYYCKTFMVSRRDYKRYFARDRKGRYIGTEQPEREWDEEELAAVYPVYDHPYHR